MPATRVANRPNHQQRLVNAALRNRVRKSYEKAQQEEAFKEFLQLIGTNGGKVPYGGVNKLIKKFKSNGFKAVTRENLYYRLEKHKKVDANDTIIGTTLSVSAENTTAVVSDLTDPSSAVTADENETTLINSKRGGRKKGSTVASKAEDAKKREEVLTRCAMLYNNEREKASKAKNYVPVGTLKKIVLEEEEKAGLTSNTISLDTVRSRVKRNNITALNPFETPLIEEVEPIICEFCI